VQEIGDWLEKLGMPEYGECFDQNKIDLSVLPHLTDQDLKDIGVPLGHRRKMLAAVAQLDDTSIAEARIPAPGSLKPQPPVASTSPPAPEAAGERRHVTVMFCDLVDSTGIATRLDAEDWRELVGSYLDAASAAVTEMGGKVAKKLGDGLMPLFGYPVAQENDPERAVRATPKLLRTGRPNH
jgi:class 3 adenylate cyclase